MFKLIIKTAVASSKLHFAILILLSVGNLHLCKVDGRTRQVVVGGDVFNVGLECCSRLCRGETAIRLVLGL